MGGGQLPTAPVLLSLWAANSLPQPFNYVVAIYSIIDIAADIILTETQNHNLAMNDG